MYYIVCSTVEWIEWWYLQAEVALGVLGQQLLQRTYFAQAVQQQQRDLPKERRGRVEVEGRVRRRGSSQ